MPHYDPEKYLYDMLSSCEFLLEFTGNRTVEDYIGERAFRSAIERDMAGMDCDIKHWSEVLTWRAE